MAHLASPATDVDREFFQRELESFLPRRVFDAHAHLLKEGTNTWKFKGIPLTLGYEEFQFFIQDLHPRRRTAALFLPGFSADLTDQLPVANAWMGEQLAKTNDCVGALFVKPDDDPDWVRQEVRRLKLHGLKCYHVFSPTRPTFEAEIPDYLPERLVKVAHDEGLFITLHMVKSRAVADPANQFWIRRYCERYPQMKMILAHSARGFQPAHNLEGLESLKGLNNVYFDSSANCEPIAHQAILRVFGHKRLMYGSDFPISHLRGRSLSAGDSFLWLYEETPVWGEKHAKINPVLVGLEHLRSMKWACWGEKLTDSQVEDVFWNNAAELFGVQ
jgi:glutamate-1-semialdehyde 2,1-aminomutase